MVKRKSTKRKVKRKVVKRTAKQATKKPRVNVIVDGDWNTSTKCPVQTNGGICFGLFLIAIAAIFYMGFQWEYALGAFGLFIILSSIMKKKY